MEKRFRIGYKNIFLTIDQIKKRIADKNHLQLDKRIIEAAYGKTILDIGCNVGTISYEIAKKNPNSEVIGVDSAEYLIEIANELYKDVPNLSYKTMDACGLGFKDEGFDSVFFLETIEHLNDPVKAIKGIHRVLKPQGLLILSTNNVYYLRFLIRHILGIFIKRTPRLMIHDSVEKWNRHIFCWDLSALYTLLNENGFLYEDHFYTGSSGFYLRNARFDKLIDSIFSKIFPIFRAIVVIKLRRC